MSDIEVDVEVDVKEEAISSDPSKSRQLEIRRKIEDAIEAKRMREELGDYLD